MIELVEIRIATYKRPDWLKKTIQSVIQQNHIHWKAIIFDDSPVQEGRAVVESFNDSRLTYSPNSKNLGASDNLNQCFDTHALAGGQYAFVLEDDNWLHPDFITSNIEAIKEYRVNIVHRNQEVWLRTTKTPTKTIWTTCNHRFLRMHMTAMQLHANVLFYLGVSNGALFFKTDIPSQLKISPNPADPSIQEFLRSLAIVENSVYLSEPKAAYSINHLSDRHHRSSSNIFHSAIYQAAGRHVYKKYGKEILTEFNKIAEHFQYDKIKINQILVNIFLLPPVTCFRQPKLLYHLLKGFVKYCLYRKAVKPYFKNYK